MSLKSVPPSLGSALEAAEQLVCELALVHVPPTAWQSSLAEAFMPPCLWCPLLTPCSRQMPNSSALGHHLLCFSLPHQTGLGRIVVVAKALLRIAPRVLPRNPVHLSQRKRNGMTLGALLTVSILFWSAPLLFEIFLQSLELFMVHLLGASHDLHLLFLLDR